ncbi:MAG: CDP-glycerol glycerophosphotransferase family protein [Sulfurovum sp.]|nr:CDP-glycerol glycerophosphotransferase family protein [Sulfurovum sp.]
MKVTFIWDIYSDEPYPLQNKVYKKKMRRRYIWPYLPLSIILMADIMISDESSAIFEFASLNKPVIINRFLTLRWSYYLNPKKILKRMDKGMNNYKKIGTNPSSYKEMIEATHRALKDKSTFEVQRLEMVKDICGLVDGQASMRITKVIKDVCGF